MCVIFVVVWGRLFLEFCVVNMLEVVKFGCLCGVCVLFRCCLFIMFVFLNCCWGLDLGWFLFVLVFVRLIILDIKMFCVCFCVLIVRCVKDDGVLKD